MRSACPSPTVCLPRSVSAKTVSRATLWLHASRMRPFKMRKLITSSPCDTCDVCGGRSTR
eukprot:998861-Rhodomonas_salina.1